MASLPTIYTPRVMLDAMQQNPRPTTFLAGLLNPTRKNSTSEILEIDVVKGGRKISTYVTRESNPAQVGKRGFSTIIHNAPYISEEVTYTARDAFDRLPGESPYSVGNPRDRLNQKVAGWLQDLQDRAIRREEQQIAEALQTGKLYITGTGVDYNVDYQMSANHIVQLLSGDRWNQTGSAKLSQLEAWAAIARNDGAPTITDVILGTNAAGYLLADTEFKAEASRLSGYNVATVNPLVSSDGFSTNLGPVRRVGLSVDLWCYQGQYTDDSGTVKNYIDPDAVILLSRNARYDMHYGPVFNLKHGTMVIDRFPFMYEDENGKAGHCALESSPLFGLHQPDAVVSVKVV